MVMSPRRSSVLIASVTVLELQPVSAWIVSNRGKVEPPSSLAWSAIEHSTTNVACVSLRSFFIAQA